MITNNNKGNRELVNADPITLKYGGSSFDSMNWSAMNYAYDPYPEKFFGNFDSVEDLATYLNGKTHNSERLLLGWYLISSNITYTISYTVRRYNSATVLTTGSFTKLGSRMFQNNVDKFLHRIDITDDLPNGFAIDNLVDVDFVVSANGPAITLPHPAIIYQYKGNDTYRFYWGPQYLNLSVGGDISFIFRFFFFFVLFLKKKKKGTDSLANDGVRIELINKTDRATTITLHSQYNRDVEVDVNTLQFETLTIGETSNVQVAQLVFSDAFLKGAYSQGKQEDYAPYVLAKHARNTFAIDGMTSLVHFYLDQNALQGFSGNIFGNTSSVFVSPEQGHIVIPLNESFLSLRQNLFNKIYNVSDLEQVDFTSCDGSLTGCLVDDYESWKNCNISTKCYSSFPIVEPAGTKFFVANSRDACKKGLKIAFNAQKVSRVAFNNSACSMLGIKKNEMWTSEVKSLSDCDNANISFRLVIDGNNCTVKYSIEGPATKGWFGVAFFGNYHVSGDLSMTGVGIVGTNLISHWTFALYYLPQKGQHNIVQLLDCGNVTAHDGKVRANCTSTFIPKRSRAFLDAKFLQFMPSPLPMLHQRTPYSFIAAFKDNIDPGL
ncbi:hypothetical protein RFI_12947 [Reticulomyxa filosa]|uniref:Uncharacterized protein n=1 Tax=Reticulomyxa filosa TaxID=46433 RepID=X6NE00_RETFI|nr:hypothetical protein RFI_12947 [Reticulomyxa filosa]|eukprot:ETO24211.1 hypothetical protein RFI_12947 [Reticulomyxa filosa]